MSIKKNGRKENVIFLLKSNDLFTNILLYIDCAIKKNVYKKFYKTFVYFIIINKLTAELQYISNTIP